MDPNGTLLGKCCTDLQESHFCVARHDLAGAKARAWLACELANQALKEDSAPRGQARALAEFALDFYRRLSKEGLAVLLLQEKLSWLCSVVHGLTWFPVLQFGRFSSLSVPPENLVAPELALPDVEVELRPPQWDAEAQLSSLSLQPVLDLYQDLLADCSFVLSLLSIQETDPDLELRRLVRAHSHSSAKVSLLLNGRWREISISTDLPFPTSPHKARSLFVRSASKPDLIWPALLEKAYLRSLGSDYKFCGSNMARDTYMLTGWLPEIRRVSETSYSSIAALFEQKKRGKVMLGLGTGSISKQLADSFHGIPQHDYVLSRIDTETELLELTNPWSSEEAESSSHKRTLSVDMQTLHHFSYLYLNWKPEYQYKKQAICIAKRSSWPEAYLADTTQYVLTNGSGEKQHVAALIEQFVGEDHDYCPTIWKGSEHTIMMTSQFSRVAGGKYVNSKLHTLFLKLDPHDSYILSLACNAERPVKFSITVHHDSENFALKRAVSAYQTLPFIEDAWENGSNGGSWTSETYINNPQYDLQIFEGTTTVTFSLAGTSELGEFAIHLFGSSPDKEGKRVRAFEERKLVLADKYSAGIFFHKATDLKPGYYKMLVSAYSADHVGGFKVSISNDGPRAAHVTKIPSALGTFCQELIFEWKHSNRRKLLVIPQGKMTSITFHLRVGETRSQTLSSYRPGIRLSMFDEFTREPVVINSDWSDSVYGIFLDCVLPSNDRRYILLIERFETGDGKFRLSTGSSGRVGIKELDG